MRVLLVEDDDGIAHPLEAGLAHHGYTVTRVSQGVDVARSLPVDIVLLDLGLPDMDGLDVCRAIRREDAKLPIIVISARGAEIDRVVGLELGADDYLAKPFGMRELIARMRAVMRRVEGSVVEAAGPPATASGDAAAESAVSSVGSAGSASDQAASGARTTSGRADDIRVRIIGPLTVDLRTHRVLVDGIEIPLTTKEFGVLSMLTDDPGAVVTRADLIEQVWDEHWYGPTKTLDVHVAQLRRKLGNPLWIENVRSVGYRLVGPDDWKR